MGWISVKNKLPPTDCGEIMVYTAKGPAIAKFEHGIFAYGDVNLGHCDHCGHDSLVTFDTRFNDRGEEITHWAKMPAKPKE